MITYFRFLLLSVNEKECCIEEKGTFLISYSNEKGLVKVYAINDFFVEIGFSEEHHCITEVIAFKSLQRLQKHADYIDLAQLSA